MGILSLLLRKILQTMEGEILSRLAASLVEVPADGSLMASLKMCGGVGFIFGVYIVQRVMKKNK